VKPTRVAMGQGISVTPLQMVNAYSTIANGGHCMRPYVISRVVAPDGTLVYRNEPKEIGRPIRPDTSVKMRAILKSVTNYAADRIDHGTGWRARVDGYTVAGKTGTAQMLINGAYSEKDYWSSFVGFVPAENPVFAMIVILDRPRGELMEDGITHKAHDGGGTAAPLFSKIASYVAQYLEIPIEVDEE
jgi:cell division protein FtsI/penicillin-binding protein 2